MMNSKAFSFCTDIGYLSVNKHDEQLCGDHVELVEQDENSIVFVLADGLGSGVKASILSTLTSKIISTMMANNMSVEDCVATMAATLPVCEVRKVAYSPFTIIRVVNNKEAEIIQYDNPQVIMLRDGKNFDYPKTINQIDGKTIYISKVQLKLDDTFITTSDGAAPKDQIIPGEKLQMGSSVKVYVSKLEIGPKGPFIMLSRSHYGFLKRLLEIEIPELTDGTVVLYSVAREAGSRSKIAVYTEYNNVDPLGAIIGEKGRRIANVLKELNGEKIDVILYDKDPVKFITNALSPAKNVKVTIKNEEKKEALALVDDSNLSLAIGRKGQNVKLASRLTHYKIEVKSESTTEEEKDSE